MGLTIAAGIWGFAEATLFFFVPDVLLSFIALRGTRRALVACAAATAGALIGGAVMYAWGARDPQAAVAALDMLPAVGARMIEGVERDLGARGLVALFAGAFTGTPFKIFAVQAGSLGIPPASFLLASIPARLLRFSLVVLVFGWLGRRAPRSWSQQRKDRIVAGFWVLFYVVFFALMPG